MHSGKSLVVLGFLGLLLLSGCGSQAKTDALFEEKIRLLKATAEEVENMTNTKSKEALEGTNARMKKNAQDMQSVVKQIDNLPFDEQEHHKEKYKNELSQAKIRLDVATGKMPKKKE